jgi:hypothetical protein
MRRDAIVLAAGAGLALGVATWLTSALPGDLPFLAKLGAPWLAVAFALGAWTRDPVRGAFNGAIALVLATGAYYAMRYWAGEYGRSPIGVWWVLVAVPGGMVFGAAGSAWRYGSGVARWLAVGVLLGALGGEGLYFVLRGGAPSLAIGELAVAAVLPLVLLSGRRDRVAAVAAAAILAVVGAVAVPVAWRGLETVRQAGHEVMHEDQLGD